jgi:hypothetical protein
MGYIQKESKIKKGVRQRCTLSPLIFNVYIQEAIDTIKDETQLGVKVNGYRINIWRFVDDIAIIVENETNLTKLLVTLEQVIEKNLHIKMNTKKTEVLVCSRDNNIKTKIKLKDDETSK